MPAFLVWGGKLPTVNQNVKLEKGWFDTTLPKFLENNDGKISFVHIDCDTFESSEYVLQCIHDRLSPGSIIIFDEHHGYLNWKNGEFKALNNIRSASKLYLFKYIAFAKYSAAVIVERKN